MTHTNSFQTNDDYYRRLFGKRDTPKDNSQSKTVLDNAKDALINVTLDNYLLFEDIKCYDASGNIVRSYDKVYVAKDVVREDDKPLMMTAYEAIEFFENLGTVNIDGIPYAHRLPDFMLSSRILVEAYKKLAHKSVESESDWFSLLGQYCDYGIKWGWHAQNTIISKGKIIHNPNDTDFQSYSARSKVNQGLRLELDFVQDYDSMLLKDAFEEVNPLIDLKNLTGLKQENWKIFPLIGKIYFRKSKFWVDNDRTKTYSTWLGCDNLEHFDINASSKLDLKFACRGVLIESKNQKS